MSESDSISNKALRHTLILGQQYKILDIKLDQIIKENASLKERVNRIDNENTYLKNNISKIIKDNQLLNSKVTNLEQKIPDISLKVSSLAEDKEKLSRIIIDIDNFKNGSQVQNEKLTNISNNINKIASKQERIELSFNNINLDKLDERFSILDRLNIMERISSSYQETNNDVDGSYERIKRSERNIIFFGSVGHGKTSLVNNLSGADFEVKESGFSVTRKIQSFPSKQFDYLLIDFPSINAAKDVLEHVQVQLSNLKLMPLKMACFVIKGGNNRYDDLLSNCSTMISIFQEYLDNICVIITNTEGWNSNKKQDIMHIFEDDLSISRIIFTKLNDKYHDILLQLHNYASKMTNIKELAIKSKDFYSNVKKGKFNIEVEKIQKLYYEDFEILLEAHKKQYELCKEKELELVRCIYFSIKNKFNKLVKEYRCELFKILGDDSINRVITYELIYQNKCFLQYDEFRMECQKLLK